VQVAVRTCAREYPLAWLELPHVISERLAGREGKECVAVLGSFASANAHQIAIGIDILELQAYCFPNTEAAAVDEHEQGSVFGIADSREQATNFIATHYSGQLAFFPRSRSCDLEIRAAKYVSRKESQSADGLILIRSRTALIHSSQKELSYFVHRDCGRGIQRSEKTTDVSGVRFASPWAVTPNPQFFVEAMEYRHAFHASNLKTDRGDTMAQRAELSGNCVTSRASCRYLDAATERSAHFMLWIAFMATSCRALAAFESVWKRRLSICIVSMSW
jgi:hypothetical protein